MAHQVGNLGRPDHRLAWDTCNVDTGTADHPFLNHCHPASGRGHLRGEGFACLAAADDNKLKMLNRHGTFLSRFDLRPAVASCTTYLARHNLRLVF
jgi:hypothetical protein